MACLEARQPTSILQQSTQTKAVWAAWQRANHQQGVRVNIYLCTNCHVRTHIGGQIIYPYNRHLIMATTGLHPGNTNSAYNSRDIY